VAPRLPIALFLAALAAAGCRGGGERLPPGTPVILISIDTLRSDHLPAYGYRGVETPALDRLRRESVLFRRAWAPTPMTLPSHVTMLTGQLPPAHGVRNNVGYRFRSESSPSLPVILKKAGYATGAAVSSYVLRAETGLASAFDFYEDSLDPRPGAAFAEYQRKGDVTAAFAEEWITPRARAPFFFFLHLYEPHVPYDPPEPFRSRFAHPYDGEIAAADAIVGKFLDGLRRLGVYDRALVILTSDHGEGLGDHGEEQHSILLYREAIQVPLLVKLPGGRRGGETAEDDAELSDLLPTVLALLGLEPPPGVQGRPLLGPAPPAATRAAYSETLYPRLQLGWSELRSLVSGRWHYIFGPRPELYDLQADPRETHDLAASSAGVAGDLRRRLDAEFPLRIERPAPVDAASAERLAALGYVGALRAPEAAAALVNPRDGLGLLARFQAASRLAGSGSPGAAADALRAIVKESPGFLEAWTRLGEVTFDLGSYDESAAAYAEAISRSLAPAPDLLLSLGRAHLRAGRGDAAAAAARRAEAELPADARELRARIALAGGRIAEAEALARSAGGDNPTPSRLLLLAQLRTRAGDPQGALQLVERAARRAAALRLGAVFGLEFERADALARLGRVEEAERAYRAEIAAHPSNLAAYANLGVLCFLGHRESELHALMKRMATANPGPAAALVAARTYTALGDASRAAEWR
jgi:arylsulfatase A-like enzyme/Flp pilus assembly protein TadD